MDISIFEDDLCKKSDGVIVYIDKLGIRTTKKTDFWIKVAAIDGNQRYFDKKDEWIVAHAEDPENPTAEDIERAHSYAMAHAILVDWSITQDGESVNYSPEAAHTYLANPAMKRFANLVWAESMRVSNFSVSKLEKEKKH